MQPFDYQSAGIPKLPQEQWSEDAHCLELLLDITDIANTVPGPKEFLQACLRRLCKAFGDCIGVSWLVDRQTQQLHFLSVEDFARNQTEPFVNQCRSMDASSLDGIPEQVLLARKSIAVSNLNREQRFARLHTAAKAGLKSVYAVPVRSNGVILGVFELFLRQVIQGGPRRLNLLDRIGNCIGVLLNSKLSAAGFRDELETQEMRLHTIIENMAEAVYLFDKDGKIILCNKAGQALTGSNLQDLMIDWSQVNNLYMPDGITKFPPDRIPAVAALRGEEVFDAEVCLRNAQHESGIWLSVNARPLRDSDGSITGAVVVARDVTLRRVLEQQLQGVAEEAIASSRLKSEFVANVSHEIRTPLAGVLGMAELLTARTDLDDEAHEVADYILHSAHNLLHIVNDLLDFSKLEAGKLTLSKQWFAVPDLLQEVAQSIAVSALKKGLQVKVQCDARIPSAVYADRGRILQVLLNFAHNAMKFTESGTVIISATEDSIVADVAKIKFAVSDTGIGISRGNLQRLFQPFVQGDGSSTRRFGGTGLGLSISKKLTELMAGEVGASSDEGIGSEFWALIPVEVERE